MSQSMMLGEGSIDGTIFDLVRFLQFSIPHKMEELVYFPFKVFHYVMNFNANMPTNSNYLG